ncbi:hypothetical protein R1A27_06515 [Methylobacterium sp. NMS12]|uniref:hypothetical protein n=1 Tax=Methylobacterium sp. NMS12 TaxID=3079766 RepID=UPI003F88374F
MNMDCDTMTCDQLGAMLDDALQQLCALDGGTAAHISDEDQPMDTLLDVVKAVTSRPLADEGKLQILHKAIGYLMTEDPQAPRGSIKDAMETAMNRAVRDAGSPLQAGLLAMVRHQLQGHRVGQLND